MTPDEYEKKIALLQRRHERERKARKSAENVLEQKSLELYQLNQSLLETNFEMEKLSVAVSQSPTAIIITNTQGIIEYTNPTFTKLTGWEFEEIEGKHSNILGSGLTPQSTFADLWDTILKGNIWKGEIHNQKKNGEQYLQASTISPILDEEGNIRHFLSNSEDITLKKEYEKRIHHLAHHDTLTGLLNRFSLVDFLENTLHNLTHQKATLAVLSVDLDHFKTVNDSHNHKTGDELLIQVAQRIRTTCEIGANLLARIGGDEFAIVLTNLHDTNAVAVRAKELLKTLNAPYVLNNHVQVSLSASIGIAVYPIDSTSSERLLKQANTAMYHVKTHGRSHLEFFSPKMDADVEESIRLTKDLRQALVEDSLELYYQPKICVKTQTICGLEALLRWNHPQLGFISPEKFIPIAEQNDLILEIGIWVIQTAFKEITRLYAQGFSQLKMAINLSAKQLEPEDLIQKISNALSQYNVNPKMVEFEITESAAMTDPTKSIEQLNKLRKLGFELTIDDFGTGYSSLAYLKTLPIQILKIDKSFVMNLETDENNAAICKATISLSHNLGYRVVAEGVETSLQEQFLITNGCDILQGYRYSKPIPSNELQSFITSFKM